MGKKQPTVQDVRKWERTDISELIRAAAFIRDTIKQKPEFAYVVECVDFAEESEVILRQAEAVMMMTEQLLRGALDGRLDFLEMLRMINDPSDKVALKKARRRLKAMSKGELPFHKDQVQ
jgi:hypothetical protein